MDYPSFPSQPLENPLNHFFVAQGLTAAQVVRSTKCRISIQTSQTCINQIQSMDRLTHSAAPPGHWKEPESADEPGDHHNVLVPTKTVDHGRPEQSQLHL